MAVVTVVITVRALRNFHHKKSEWVPLEGKQSSAPSKGAWGKSGNEAETVDGRSSAFWLGKWGLADVTDEMCRQRLVLQGHFGILFCRILREHIFTQRHLVSCKNTIKLIQKLLLFSATITGFRQERLGIKSPCWFYQRRKLLSNSLNPLSRFIIEWALSFQR